MASIGEIALASLDGYHTGDGRDDCRAWWIPGSEEPWSP
jgi:hypothetical protein